MELFPTKGRQWSVRSVGITLLFRWVGRSYSLFYVNLERSAKSLKIGDADDSADLKMLKERMDLLSTKDRQWGEIIEQLRALQAPHQS